ncbi:helicase POLQ-like [Ylistrum balloti]|uniref:helicase POLQ-like n=1 Tax=Ylistrum balloti TaxID=509963 RepID=UPI002905E8BF|nr:helicase POLQ-like [Ylistrum balloti]
MNENEAESSGPCRKVGRSGRRNLTPYYPYDHLTDHGQESRKSNSKNLSHQKEIALLSEKQIDTRQTGAISARNVKTACRIDKSYTSNYKDNTWFSNSFVSRSSCSVGKKNIGHAESSCQRTSSIPKRLRLDVDFSQKSQSDPNFDAEIVEDLVKNRKHFSDTDHNDTEDRSGNLHVGQEEPPVKPQTGMASTLLRSERNSHLLHSTPIKNHKMKTRLEKSEVISTEAEYTLNNSDHILAGLDMSYNVNEGKTDSRIETNLNNSHISDPNQDQSHICKSNQHNGSSDVISDNSTIERKKCHSIKSGMSKAQPQESVQQTKCIKHMDISDDDIFAPDSDFLSQIESLEKQADIATDKQVMTEKAISHNTTSQLVLQETRKNKVFLKSCDKSDNSDESKHFREKTAGSGTKSVDQDQLGVHISTVLETKHFTGPNQTDKTSPMETKGQSPVAISAPEVSTTMKTPNCSGLGSSLKDRIKRRLQENALTKLVHSPGAVMEQRREAEVSVATEEQIQRDGTDLDIGPFYGLSSKVKTLLQQHRGINSLYAWQDECLNLSAVLEGKNLIYSLPTSGGKTLVAEILIMRELLCKKKDAILILPFVSIVQEKVRGLSPFGIDLDFLVEEYAGSKGKFPPIKRRKRPSLYIATIEKAHSLVNSLIENNRMDSLGLVVVDELHMIGEGGSRGATLESTLLKVIYTHKKTQIVGMSATLSNISDLQTFLGAEVYSNNFRPVELTEYAKLQDNIYQVNPKAKCPEDQLVHDRVVMFKYTPDMTRVDGDHLLGLVLEVIPQKSCLLFCPTKKNCENVAMMLCKLLVKHHHELSLVKKTERKALLKELYNDGAGKICPVLQYTLHFGVAYHHSGLTSDERRLIEDAYVDGTLCLLTCTSTLAAGVNLPAKRVILRSPYVGSQFISRNQYKQMVGRAGRAGIDSSGESILITKSSDTEKVGQLLTAPLEVCRSSLMYDDGKGIRGLILSVVGLQMTKTTREVFACMEKTLLSVQASCGVPCDIVEVTRQSLQQLIDLGLIIQKLVSSQETDQDLHHLEVTNLGRATFKGSVNLEWSGRLYSDLQQAEESLVLSSHLHLLYLVTPYDKVTSVKPSWIVFFQEMSNLNPVELKMAALIGVPEGHIARKASGQNSRQKVDEFVVGRFYLTLMLYGLWKQRSVWEVSEKFQQSRGFVQNLLSSAASFASCVYHFCQELDELWPYQDLFGNFVQRLAYCVSSELIPLMEIPGVKLGRAKQMFNVGYRTLSQVANAEPDNLVKKIKPIPRKTAQQIVTAAKMLLNEKAEALWQEVEDLVMVPETVSTQPSPELSSQGSVASSDILSSLTDWAD